MLLATAVLTATASAAALAAPASPPACAGTVPFGVVTGTTAPATPVAMVGSRVPQGDAGTSDPRGAFVIPLVPAGQSFGVRVGSGSGARTLNVAVAAGQVRNLGAVTVSAASRGTMGQGLPAAAVPLITSVTPLAAAADQRVVISGSDFGEHAPYNGDTPYLQVTDVTACWHAGDSIAPCCPNSVFLDVTSWTDDRITIAGFTGAYGGPWAFSPNDQVLVWVRNPETDAGPAGYLLRVSATLPKTGSGPIVPVAGVLLVLLGAALWGAERRCLRANAR